jgi:hypothetical protein
MLALEPQHGELPRDPRTGWWVEDSRDAATSIVVECMGERAMAAFLDAAGWSLVVGSRSAPGRYDGEWLRFSGGQTDTGPYRAPGNPRTTGTASLEWPDDGVLVALLPGGRRATYRRLGAAESPPQNLRSTEKCAS